MNFAPPRAPRPLITVIGDIGIDLVMGPLDAWPEIGTETLMPRSEMRAGGSAGNVALALKSLGTPVRLISAIGNDPLGQWLAGQLDGIDAELSVIDATTSISVGVLHENGERNFFTTRGHLERQTWTPPPPVKPGDIALLTGAFLLPLLRSNYQPIMQQLRGLGYAIAIDTGWPSEGFTSGVIAEVRTWLALADHVLLNELEITRLAGNDDLSTAMATLSALMPVNATLVAKIGKDGAIAWRGKEKAVARPLFLEAVFDTIGAGDAFNAGYLSAVAQGMDLTVALSAGCETATRIIAQFPRSMKENAWQTGG